MKRRCYFLDNLSHYNYNYGRSAQYTGSKETKVNNTEHLGSTLMEAMRSEVSEFCDPKIKGTWSCRAHQQVCLSDYDIKDAKQYSMYNLLDHSLSMNSKMAVKALALSLFVLTSLAEIRRKSLRILELIFHL